MATDFFLKIDGIDGESTDDKHKGELEIESWSWGATNMGTMGRGGGGGSGKADFSDITITKYADKSTPKLLKAVAEGQHIKNMLLTCRKASGSGGQVEYLKVTLEDVMISGYLSSASNGNPIPSESVVLNYAKIKYEYAPQKGDGSLEGFIPAGYDRHANKAT
jgi:type VI secretion system secreted protein Hcp